MHVRCAAQEMGTADLLERLSYCEPPLSAEERVEVTTLVD
jgi:hypothetical protein